MCREKKVPGPVPLLNADEPHRAAGVVDLVDVKEQHGQLLHVALSDGSVEGLEFVARSGSSDFDFRAMGAVECAGNGRFGPLPEDLPFQPVQFNFRPAGEPLEVFGRYGRPTEVTIQ